MCVHFLVVRLSLLYVLQWIIFVAGATGAFAVLDIVAVVLVFSGCSNVVKIVFYWNGPTLV